jgi:hypothetical protein
MSNVTIPRGQWDEFLDGFSERHAGWLACLETHDTKTGETVSTRYLPFEEIALDTEDTKNARINVTVDSDNKVVKHIFFRPTRLTLQLSKDQKDESLHIESLNTSTTVRFRSASAPSDWERAKTG